MNSILEVIEDLKKRKQSLEINPNDTYSSAVDDLIEMAKIDAAIEALEQYCCETDFKISSSNMANVVSGKFIDMGTAFDDTSHRYSYDLQIYDGTYQGSMAGYKLSPAELDSVINAMQNARKQMHGTYKQGKKDE